MFSSIAIQFKWFGLWHFTHSFFSFLVFAFHFEVDQFQYVYDKIILWHKIVVWFCGYWFVCMYVCIWEKKKNQENMFEVICWVNYLLWCFLFVLQRFCICNKWILWGIRYSCSMVQFMVWFEIWVEHYKH